MPIRITSTRQALDSVKMTVYGPSGVGKTSLCATAPRPVIISAEKGLLSLADKDIPVIEVFSIDEFKEAYEYLTGEAGDEFDTICIDSISELSEKMLGDFSKQYADGRKAYGKLNEEFMELLRKFRDIPGKHVLFIAKQNRIEDSHTGITTFGPSLPGKTLVREMPYLTDMVFCLRIGTMQVDGANEEYRYLQTQPSVTHDAKDRSGILKPIERPDLGVVIKKIMGKAAPKKKADKSETKKEETN